MTENICRFLPFNKQEHSIHTINFVLETKPQVYTELKYESVYKMYYVCNGQGVLHTCGKISALEAGDIFFTFPGYAFAIESKDGFAYMYISFVGVRGNLIMESLKIGTNNFIFHNAAKVREIWEKGISLNTELSDLASEAVLLYTFSFLGSINPPNKVRNKQNGIDFIKKYIDDHFTEQDFSLESISRELSYNKKYISYIFKKQFGVGAIEYLNTIRIQNACTMMEQGFTSVSDIADKCGYSDSQYFSKIFKTKTGFSPTDYIKELKQTRNRP